MSCWPDSRWAPGRWAATSAPTGQPESTRRSSSPHSEPFLLKTDTNPAGLDGTVFAAALAAAVKDRYAFLHRFYADVYNTDETLGIRISGDVIESSWKAACSASAYASVAAVITWTTDFRADVAKIAGYDIGVLIVHGTHDRILPINATARPLHALLPRANTSRFPARLTVCCGPTPTTSTTNYWPSSPTEPVRQPPWAPSEGASW